MGCRIVFGSSHPVERKNGDFAALRRLVPKFDVTYDCHLIERSWMEVGRVLVPNRLCMTTLCPTTGWPPVTWKGSGAHVPPSVQAA
ncbi:unnamed protein product [Spirodela intermedia]|uniref:Uncharacterized protein n=1 Tax=Spirodela intermedia TaxID=51605 RepID=A0A7I8KKS6_SPIIN|nr:unnamed protein product [Spirodela intermedia]